MIKYNNSIGILVTNKLEECYKKWEIKNLDDEEGEVKKEKKVVKKKAAKDEADESEEGDEKPAKKAVKKKKEKEVPGKAEHLKHPQLKGPDAQHLMNDLAYHLHHPQFLPQEYPDMLGF